MKPQDIALLLTGDELMIGDTVDDVRAARRADVLALGFTNRPSPDGVDALLRAGAGRVLARIDELEELLP